MPKVGIATFVKQVRQEVSKVAWPTRQETVAATIIVIVFSLLLAFFFFAVDQVLAWVVKLIFGLGG